MVFPFGGKLPVQTMELWDVLHFNASGTWSAVSGTNAASAAGGVVGSIVIGGGTMGAISITDFRTASGGSTLLHLATPSGNTQYWMNTPFSTGLTYFASAATMATIYYYRAY